LRLILVIMILFRVSALRELQDAKLLVVCLIAHSVR
jgi:hypothetical protein